MERSMCTVTFKVSDTEVEDEEVVGYSEMGMAGGFFVFSWEDGTTRFISADDVQEITSMPMKKPEMLNG